VIRLTVRVIPRASRSGIAGVRDGALLVRLQSPPVEGAANEELIDILARTFGAGRRDISIESGTRSKLKRIAIERIDRREFELVLQSLGINPQELNSRHDRRETP
jgi:uncharacterized protein (TIGR00251 family)